MKLDHSIASVRIDGNYVPLAEGVTVYDGLNIRLALENKAENFYSWVVRIENTLDTRSSRITELLGLDTTIAVSGEARMNTLRGDDCTVRSFFPESFTLVDGETVSRAPVGARSSDTSAFPYFDLSDESGAGVVCGIGWSGEWKLDVTRCADSVRLLAGFYDCDFYLEPHESVRSVRVLLYIGEGGEDRLRQQFVRLHREHYSPIPRIEADTYFPLSVQCFDRYYWANIRGENGLNFFETEEAQLCITQNAAKCKQFNTFWLDACWFDGACRTGVGNYRYAEGFPYGLKQIADSARAGGMRFMLWFEPVRAMKDTDIYKAFSGDDTKLIPLEGSTDRLVNLGDPEVRAYQLENISRIIAENGVAVYRQDFNLCPLEALRSIEVEGRRGIAQIRFVEGIYQLWDSLSERFPGLVIDNCASGGRLIDVETNMRAIPCWRSDMACRPSPISAQNEILGLSKYVPYHQGSSFDYTPYFLRSAMTTGIACEFGFISGKIDPAREESSLKGLSSEKFLATEVKNRTSLDPVAAEAGLRDAMRLREYWQGDFTALTTPADHRGATVAYQLHLADENRGVAVVLRREEAPEEFSLKLSGLKADGEYELILSDEALAEKSASATGELLMNGFPVRLEEAPSSLLLFYRLI